jgi:hypothetical protein
MKNIAWVLQSWVLFILISTIPLGTQAQTWKEDYAPPPGVPPIEHEGETAARAQDLKWLFEKLFPVEVRSAEPVEVQRSFEVHLLDTYQEFPDPGNLRFEKLRPLKPIQGKITYVSIVQKLYAYDVFQGEDGAVVINVKIHLQNPSPEDVIAFTEKVQGAQEMWNSHALKTDFAYRFQFEVVKTAAEAPFSVKIVNSTRGPYDTFWGRDWTPSVIAHEIGHMMGLADEYLPFGKAYGCHMPSLMCSTSGAPMLHDYYFLLRRLVY